MRKFYIKKLGSQELGSPKDDGKISRGRYIYISMDCAVFFPHLSKLQNNDTVVLPIIAPFSDAKIYSRFVYHNDKFNITGGTRNEYRLYLNKDLDKDRKYFQINDIVVFERVDKIIDGSVSPLYFIHIFNYSNEYFSYLNELVLNSDIRGNHALYYGNLEFIPVSTFN
ncbi:MAG: HNH endonuclease, partial [Flavobacteriales bacterium]|nr:HNH endonuclease [Flavobacteriales bacterium]